MDKDVFDLDAALGRMEGDRELLEDMIEIFLGDYPNQVNEIRTAIANDDGENLTNAAHALKGSVGNFAAKNLFEIALSLEKDARNLKKDKWSPGLNNLETEFTKLEAALKAVLS